MRKQCGFTWGYISSVEKMIKSNKPPLNFSTFLYNTYKQRSFNVLFFIETSIQKYLTDCGGFNSRYGYRLAMTRGKFVMRSNIWRASHEKRVFSLSWILFIRSKLVPSEDMLLPAGGSRLGSSPIWHSRSSVKRPCHDATKNTLWTMWFSSDYWN